MPSATVPADFAAYCAGAIAEEAKDMDVLPFRIQNRDAHLSQPRVRGGLRRPCRNGAFPALKRGLELDEEAESKKKIEEVFAVAGLKVPALHEVIAGLKVDKSRAQKIVTLLLRDKVLTKISDELVFHRNTLEDLRRLVAKQKLKSPRMDVAKFKELTGVSRKYAIPLLEYLDREHVTRREGDERIVIG